MATIGKLDKNKTIVEIITTADDHEDGKHGTTWAKNRLGGSWVVCTVGDREPAKNIIPGIGYTYDSTRDLFIPPKPFDSWSLNETTWRWEAPVAKPSETEEDLKTFWVWNEEVGQWEAAPDSIA